MPHESPFVTLPLGSPGATSEIVVVAPGSTAATIQGIPGSKGWGGAVVAIEWSLDGRQFIELDTELRLSSTTTGRPGIDIGNATHLRFKVITADGAADAQCPFYVQTGLGTVTVLTPDPLIIVKSIDESKASDISAADDNELFLSVVANTTYIFEALIWGESASVTPDIKMAWNGPSGMSMRIWMVIGRTGATNITRLLFTSVGTTQGLQLSGTVDREGMVFHGVLTVGSTAGTLAFQWAQNTSDATATVVLAKSWLRLTKV